MRLYLKMNKILKFFIIFSLVTNPARAQLTIKDFRLCLDHTRCADTVLSITKADLLKSKTITPNYSWFTIESAVVYTGPENEGSDLTIVNLPGNQFNAESRKIFERLHTGGLISIQVKGHNKQNVQVEWGTLFIRIVE